MRPRTAQPIIDVEDLLASLPGNAKTGRSWFESEIALLRQLNPIERLVLQATIVNHAWTRAFEDDPHVLDLEGVLLSSRAREAVQFAGHRAVASSIEDGGVLGASLALHEHRHLLPIFSNDLAYTRFGIDVVARNQRDGRFLICEAKGTINPIRPAGTYLKETRHKGRQLSWQWCWSSLCEFALQGATARIFLLAFRDLLRGKAERCLAVTRLVQHRTTWLIDHTRILYERELLQSSWLAEKPVWSRQLEWLRQLDSRKGQRRQRDLRFLVEILSTAAAEAIKDASESDD